MKTSIQPWLTVGNSAEAEAFYKNAFGAVETYRMESPDGGLVLQLSVGDATFWVSGQSTGANKINHENKLAEFIKILLVVDDPEIFFERAIKEGAKTVFPISEDYGWRLGRITDPFGFDWEIGKEL